MRIFFIIFLCGIFVLNSVNASEIRLYDVKDLVKLPNVVNTEYAIKQRVEIEAKLLHWNLVEPLRNITRMPQHALQSIATINHTPTAPEAPTLEQKATEWKAIECQRFNRCK